MALTLTEHDQAMLGGAEGEGVALAMRVVCRVADAMEATSLLDIVGAHIDSCLFHGRAGLDFADRLVTEGAMVRVPTTLNVSSLDLLHPELYRGDPEEQRDSRRLMELYESLGCRPTWTCAPYQGDARPELGQHVAWAESNAIVFANSVLGARTHRYGDFIDICAAVTGRAPAAGLHLDAQRRATVVFDCTRLSEAVRDHPVFPAVLGHLIGHAVGSRVPAVTGLGPLDEDQLKALGSAAASSGSVGMFHVVGTTPEAPTLSVALGDRSASEVIDVSLDRLRAAWSDLSTVPADRPAELGAVSLGTPHYSVAECGRLVELLEGRSVHPDVALYVNLGRTVLTEISLRGWTGQLEQAGVQLVTDTCTYITPVMAPFEGVALTDSPKWAYYAPGNLGVEVVFASTADCVESAVTGRLVRGNAPW